MFSSLYQRCSERAVAHAQYVFLPCRGSLCETSDSPGIVEFQARLISLNHCPLWTEWQPDLQWRLRLDDGQAADEVIAVAKTLAQRKVPNILPRNLCHFAHPIPGRTLEQ